MTRIYCKKGTPLAERLAAHSVVAPSGCWIWMGFRSPSGYGRIQVDGESAYAHRVSYQVHAGEIPTRMQIDHLCRRPACINPQHLQPVTPSINVRRGTSQGARALRRTKCKFGHPYAEFGVVHAGRRVCRMCRAAALARYKAKPRDNGWIKPARLAAGIGLAQAADALGISAGFLALMERGEQDVSPKTLAALRDLLEASEKAA